MRKHLFAIVLMMLSAASVSEAQFNRVIRENAGGGGAGVNLPYQQPDGMGSQWMVYQMGWLQQQGMNPVYSQGAMLMINGNQVQARNNRARIDEKSGELVLDEANVGGVMVSRRIFFSKDEQNIVRIVDVIRNPQAQEAKVNVGLQTSTNYGINMANTVNDPKKKDQAIGWVAQTGNGRCVMEMYAGKGAKIAPVVNYVQGNNNVDAQTQVTVPPNKAVALVHFHGVTNSMEQGTKWMNDLKEPKVLAGLPREIRRIVINFGSTANFIGDLEILRGDVQDVVELRGGDLIKGTIKDTTYKLTASFGEIDLPVSNILGMMNVGQFRPRQLIVTSDGQIFGGTLAKSTVDLQLSSGQVTQIPLAQVSRVGMRKSATEGEEPVMMTSFVQLRSGDRVSVQPPEKPIEVVTRYGRLALQGSSISAIQFQVEEHGVHDVYLTDGSKFAGLVSADAFDFKLVTGGKTVTFPVSSIFRLQLQKVDEDGEATATLKLANGDLLVGTLEGQLKLDTAFDTIAINGPEIRQLTHPRDTVSDVQATLWDQTTLTGQLQSATVQCKLASGPVINVPPALIDVYNQPLPRPSDVMIEKIKATVADLNADDWKQRDKAEADLVQMGIAVVGVLKDMRASQTPESQQRIDSILKQVQKPAAKK